MLARSPSKDYGPRDMRTRRCIPLVPLLLSFVLPAAFTGRAIADASANAYSCASQPGLVAPCFEVRGRLSFWNGAPSARIWRVGTKRMLGVHLDRLPPALEVEMDRFDPRQRFDTEAWANFTVCPFTPSVPGRMQFVCIESWRRLAMRHRTR